MSHSNPRPPVTLKKNRRMYGSASTLNSIVSRTRRTGDRIYGGTHRRLTVYRSGTVDNEAL